MGVVHKAEDIRLSRLVALKFLSGAFAHDPAAKNADGTSFVDLTVSNVGTGNARKLRVDLVAAFPTRGNGMVKVVSPAFPMTIGIGNLDSGASQTIRIVLKFPARVKQFQLAEVAFVQTVTP